MSDFILEIGSEEIPARFLPIIQNELSKNTTEELNINAISFDKLNIFVTARRTILYVQNIALKSSFKEEEVLGPAKNIAYDANGNMSKALEGFLRGHKLETSALFAKTTSKGEYFAAIKKTGGIDTAELLKEICPKLIKLINFPKRMRWGSSPFLYARPLRWVLALLDEQVINFSLTEHITSSNITYGHRILSSGSYIINSPKDLLDTLPTKGFVIFDQEQRKQVIITKANELAKSVNGKIIWQDSLLEEVCGLTEFPVPILGKFNDEYLDIPKEVLLTSMQSHQKSFGVEDNNGKLLPYFLAVSNLQSEKPDAVVFGWQRVLKARLEDAKFFWQSDLKQAGFTNWINKLDSVTFLAPVGSVGDKTRRLEKLCAFICQELNLNNKDIAAKAGRFSKADLVSDMVNEFDSLQGIMGGIYAKKFGESELLALALAEQYLPLANEMPKTELGAILSMADKMDTLIACFGLNNIPTGAADPYALRRATLGIIRICLENNYKLDLNKLIDFSFSLFSENIKWKLSFIDLKTKLLEFINTRLKNYYQTMSFDVLQTEAILNIQYFDIPTTFAKLQALQEFTKHEDFEKFVLVAKRINNILKKEKLNCEIKTSSFTPEDKNLYAEIEQIQNKLAKASLKEKYTELAKLGTHIDSYFEKVMIMDKDTDIKNNRLTLLNNINNLFIDLADFNALQV